MFKRLIASLVCCAFILSNLQYVHAENFSIDQLPVPGTMVETSLPFSPLALKGLIVNPQKPLEFQFIVDTGSDVSLRGALFSTVNATKQSQQEQLKQQANQLVKYFLAGLTIPEGDLWVNLSPYEKDRMLPAVLGQTDLGRDLLAQDYILKQLTASLIYPEKELGKEFWSRVYAKAQQQFGTTNIPVNTFNKVWILPKQAQVYENGSAVYVTQSTLKVMLDEDYMALHKHMPVSNGTDSIGANIVREIVLPEIEKEVNTGKNFAPLRQIYQALILAKWYKETIQNGLLDAVYTDKNKVAGVNLKDPLIKEQIYNRYLQAYKKGAFNYIKDGLTPDGQVLPRKYFSGGLIWQMNLRRDGAMSSVKSDGAMLSLTVVLAAGALGAYGLYRGILGKNNKVQGQTAQREIAYEEPEFAGPGGMVVATGNMFYFDQSGTWIENPTAEEIAQWEKVKRDAAMKVKATPDECDHIQAEIDKIEAQLNIGQPESVLSQRKQLVAQVMAGLRSGKILLRHENTDVLDSFEENAKSIGVVDRELLEKLFYIHQTNNAFILTPAGDILLQRRVNGSVYPLHLTILGGHLTAGQNYAEGIRRELSEELDLPSLAGKINEVGIDKYDRPSDPNRERRMLYTYVLTPEEYAAIMAKNEHLEQLRKSMTQAEYSTYLSKEREAKSGYGEVWEYYQASLEEIEKADKRDNKDSKIGKPDRYLSVENEFKDGTIKQDAFFTPDLFDLVLDNPQLISPIQKEVKDLRLSLAKKFSILTYNDLTEDEIKAKDIDVLMIPGNDDINVYRKVLDLKAQGIGKYLLISGGTGRLTLDIKRTADENGLSVEKTSEAQMIRSILIQMARGNKKWEVLVPDLENDDLVILEPKASYTVQNFQYAKEELKKRGLLSENGAKALKILYIQKPLQQLRTKGNFESVFKNEIAAGQVEGISFTSEYLPNEKMRSDMVGEFFRIVANGQKGDWVTKEGYAIVPDNNWIEALELFNTLSTQEKDDLVKILWGNVVNMKLTKEDVLKNLTGNVAVFTKHILDYLNGMRYYPVASPTQKNYEGQYMYHAVPKAFLDQQRAGGIYTPERFDADKFIHFSADIPTALKMANRFYANTTDDIVLLKVNAQQARSSGKVVIDDGKDAYPHLYGHLNLDAVAREATLVRGASGLELSPADINFVMFGQRPIPQEIKKQMTEHFIERMKRSFQGLPVPTETIEKIMKALEDESLLPSDGFELYYDDKVHGFDHSIEITRKVFEWVKSFNFTVDTQALAVAAFLHDINGLGSFGNLTRKIHHLEGGKFAESILQGSNDGEWPQARIDHVKRIIETHRGVPENYKAEDYPAGYISEVALKMPKPDSIEGKLLRDADTYIELINFERLMQTSLDFRKIHGLSNKYYDPAQYGNEAGQVQRRLEVILNDQRRNKAADTDPLEFLLGKLLEDCDPNFFDLKEVQDLIRNEAVMFFKGFLKLTIQQLKDQPQELSEAISVIKKLVPAMDNKGAERVTGDVSKWRSLNEFHQEALKAALTDLAMTQTPKQKDTAMFAARTRIAVWKFRGELDNILSALNDKDSGVRKLAMDALDSMKTAIDYKMKVLPQILDNKNIDVREWARNRIDGLVISAEQKREIYQNALNVNYSDVKSWAKEKLESMVYTTTIGTGDQGHHQTGNDSDWEYMDGSNPPAVSEVAYTGASYWYNRQTGETSTTDPRDHALNGGIDLNKISIKRTGKVINVQFDQAQLSALMRGGFEGFTPVIINITPISNPLLLLGIKQAKDEVTAV